MVDPRYKLTLTTLSIFVGAILTPALAQDESVKLECKIKADQYIEYEVVVIDGDRKSSASTESQLVFGHELKKEFIVPQNISGSRDLAFLLSIWPLNKELKRGSRWTLRERLFFPPPYRDTNLRIIPIELNAVFRCTKIEDGRSIQIVAHYQAFPLRFVSRKWTPSSRPSWTLEVSQTIDTSHGLVTRAESRLRGSISVMTSWGQGGNSRPVKVDYRSVAKLKAVPKVLTLPLLAERINTAISKGVTWLQKQHKNKKQYNNCK